MKKFFLFGLVASLITILIISCEKEETNNGNPVLIDENNNGKWDLGDYHKRQQPERVSYYPDQITLKENWEVLDININID